MLHHISLGVVEIERAAAFFDAVLEPLGYVRVWSDMRPGEHGQAVGYGVPGGGDNLALKQIQSGASLPMPGFHIAFAAGSHDAVSEFHAAALRAGGKDNGAPGLREHYGPNYFAAFVISPEGYHLEAVCKSSCS
jgi:catechol 2,3-dioxygenase-like lactoylglutathione lyase family enzyme